jgi:cytochrome c-type biogenesis protein CcmH/NrfG
LTKKVNKLLSDARQAEKDGKQQDALSDYAEVLKLQPGNPEAQSSTERIEQAVKSDPAAAKTELKAAIRYFYNSQFDDARRALMSYLESPQTATDPGVADFYLGATLVERSILQTPRAQWQGPSKDALLAFKQARKANYNPARAYVSPTLLKIWDSTAQ